MVQITRCGALVCALFALAFSPAAAATSSPPVLIAPYTTAVPPVLFTWTPVIPGTVYNLTVGGHTRTSALTTTPVVAVTYELQISDRPDVGGHVLFDQTVDTTSLLFENRNVEGAGFTQFSPPGEPLPGGLYYWRVRAEAPNAPWSAIGRFILAGGGASTTPFHDLGIIGIGLAAVPVAGVTTPLVARVANLGTFPEEGATLVITAEGAVAGRAMIPRLLPGERVNVSVPWTPAGRGGLAQIGARLDYSDQNGVNDVISQAVLVASPQPVRTSLSGTLVHLPGGYALADRSGRIAAVLTFGFGHADPSALTGVAVVADGMLVAHGSGLLLDVTALHRSSP
jgi:hypothetical protein